MLLHWSPRSPYVRKVMIAAYEMGLSDHLHCVRTVVGGTTPHLELMRENPLGKIPTLMLTDGTIIYDSPVVCEYLDTLHAGPKLFLAGADRILALRRLALGDGMLDIALALLSEKFRPTEAQSQPHIDLWIGKLQACIPALEQEADALAASVFSIGHIAIGIALAYLDFRFAELNWRDGHPKLTAWHATFNARASVQANLPVDDR
ncbi:MAG: glutathione S-transferase family protein [Acetobacteraceae bacterium]|nr:glutathione S-transferase family protein [Acetobacteraceae bacterium]MSP29791.1 glutathione S-transferase family protein [Acetobacteraceae bacterium]